MIDLISYYDGTKPKPLKSMTWQEAVGQVADGTYQDQILKARSLTGDKEAYREFKKRLPAVTFGGTFNGRRAADAVLTTTGLIIPDLDHLADVDKVFDSLCQDERILFAFRSPGGDGIKCGLRAKDIGNDADHKRFFAAVERYFSEVYAIKIDPACKDISRLTFVSHDPETWVNPKPCLFNIEAWADRPPPQFQHNFQCADGDMRGPALYAWKVLESACSAIRDSAPGTQHSVRLAKARLVGGYIHHGLDLQQVMNELESAVRASGAKNVEAAMKTVLDGLDNGMANPIEIPKTHGTHGTHGTHETHETANSSEKLTETHENSRNSRATHAEKGRFQGNLTGSIREYVLENQGSFTSADLDREFGLTDPKDKDLRRRACASLQKEMIITKDRRVAGKYHILQQDVDWINLDEVTESYFSMNLPLGLTEMVNLPQKCICVLAGSSNAGKTAILLEILRLNLSQKYGRFYMMSEMGGSEYKQRVSRLPTDINLWKKNVRAAAVSSGFDGPIAKFNRDGLTVIDFLEEIDGEYYKITSDIRTIYDALGEGVAWVALQKKTESAYGRGGEATSEKARLYLSLDMLLHQPQCTISALRIVKAKDYPGQNPNGKEIHVRITGGSHIEVIPEFGGWQYVNKAQRAQWITRYEHMAARGWDAPITDEDKLPVAKFLCKDGKYRFINQKTCNDWQDNFQHINVEKELEGIARYAEKTPINNSYMQHICGMLLKKNNSKSEKK